MKIGICTFHDRDNYGAVWQAWATVRFLRDQGLNAELINYRGKDRTRGWRRWIGRTPAATKAKWIGILTEVIFERFRRRRLPLSGPPVRSPSQLAELAGRKNYAALAAGSDQLWNPVWLNQKADFWSVYLLEFGDLEVARVSLATSIGHASIATIPASDLKRLGASWEKFKFLSVRESSGQEIIREACGRTDAVHLVDPTLWISPAAYEGLLPGVSSRRYVFTMALHGDDDHVVPLGRESARRLNAEHWICNLCRLGRVDERTRYVLPTPEQWLRVVADAALVVTNSYHAAVFSLIWNVPLMVVSAPRGLGNMNDRFRTLEALMSAESCNYCNDASDIEKAIRRAGTSRFRRDRWHTEVEKVANFCAAVKSLFR